MPTNQLTVLDQTKDIGGDSSCGYHAIKNSLLSLMYLKGSISKEKMANMIKDSGLFRSIYNKTVRVQNERGDTDLSLPQFIEILMMGKNGELDFSKHGVSSADLRRLNLSQDGSEDLSVVNIYTYFGGSEYGLNGMEEDLFVAAAAARLARNKGEQNHVFAFGVNNEHWVVLMMQQNSKGERAWQFMDSWKNQAKFKDTVVHKIEEILNKDAKQLREYLLNAYDNSSDMFNRRYNAFFNIDGTQRAERVEGFGSSDKPESKNAKEYFIDEKNTLTEFTGYIENRFSFMQTAGWLEATKEQELVRIKQLYHISSYILNNATEQDLQAKNKLASICEHLKSSMDRSLQKDTVIAPFLKESTGSETASNEKMQLDAQTAETLYAIKHQKPKATESYFQSLVTSISNLIEEYGTSFDAESALRIIPF